MRESQGPFVPTEEIVDVIENANRETKRRLGKASRWEGRFGAIGGRNGGRPGTSSGGNEPKFQTGRGEGRKGKRKNLGKELLVDEGGFFRPSVSRTKGDKGSRGLSVKKETSFVIRL